MDDRFVSFLKEHAMALLLAVAGVICLGYGLISLAQPQKADTGIQFQSGGSTSSGIKKDTSSAEKTKQITIDVEGAVQKPGVYKLPSTSRIKDALVIAGGLSKDADREKVAQNLNLAAPLTDSAKIYIPSVGEQMAGSGSTSESTSEKNTSVLGSTTSVVNINQASQSEIESLPGIGPVTAQKIISNRPYQSVQELVDKKAVGASVFGKIKDLVSVY